jgi:hypothetical protein
MEVVEPAPLWWYKFWRSVSAVICEALWLFNVPLPGQRLRDEYGTIADVWCCHIHSAFETYVWEREGYPVRKAKVITSDSSKGAK